MTAYHEHAVRAFDVHAVDYLTKPVDAERLATALKRVREKIAAKIALLTQEQFTAMLSGLRNSEESRSYPSSFLVKDGEKEILLPVENGESVAAHGLAAADHTASVTLNLRASWSSGTS